MTAEETKEAIAAKKKVLLEKQADLQKETLEYYGMQRAYAFDNMDVVVLGTKELEVFVSVFGGVNGRNEVARALLQAAETAKLDNSMFQLALIRMGIL